MLHAKEARLHAEKLKYGILKSWSECFPAAGFVLSSGPITSDLEIIGKNNKLRKDYNIIVDLNKNSRTSYYINS